MSNGKQNTFGLTVRQEKFARLLALGKPLIEAGALAGYESEDPGNLWRRAHHPKVKARIEALRAEARDLREIAREAQRNAADREFQEEGINLKWLVGEAKNLMMEARAAEKFREALDSLKFIAELTGHTSNVKAGRDDPNKIGNKPNVSTPTPIALQVINQWAEPPHHHGGKLLEAQQATPITFEDGTGPPLDDDGHGGATEVLDDELGDDLEPIHGPPEAGSPE